MVIFTHDEILHFGFFYVKKIDGCTVGWTVGWTLQVQKKGRKPPTTTKKKRLKCHFWALSTPLIHVNIFLMILFISTL